VKSFVKTALFAGVAFGVPMGIFFGVRVGIVQGFSAGISFGLVSGAASGLAFGLALAIFMAIQRRRFSRARPEFSGEQLLHDGPANHFLNGEAVGGWLFLTRERVLFRSHQFNIQPHELSVPLAEIAEVQPVRAAWIFPNGLRLVTRSGREERFVVEAHRKWRDEILSALRRVA
jgi:GRAM domain